MRSHIFVHRATAKYFSNSFVFKTEVEKEGLPGDITPALGAGGPRFESGRPDHEFPPLPIDFQTFRCSAPVEPRQWMVGQRISALLTMREINLLGSSRGQKAKCLLGIFMPVEVLLDFSCVQHNLQGRVRGNEGENRRYSRRRAGPNHDAFSGVYADFTDENYQDHADK